MLYIRADANPTIATGHVMRCIAIAKEVKKLGEEVIFITADLQSKDIIESSGFSIISLDSDWNDLDKEIVVLVKLIKEYHIKKLLIDSYYVTEHYLTTLRDYTTVCYIDDLAMFPYPVDVVINYNNYAHDINYETRMDKSSISCKPTQYILGCQYAPLREEFRHINTTCRSTVQSVLITTGGSDSYHVAIKLLEHIVEKYFIHSDNHNIFEKLAFHVIVGRFNTDHLKLDELASKYPQIILHYNVTNMSQIMSMCDIAVTAGGSTMYELCACSVPMITYAFADNQLPGVRGFEKLGVAQYCGDLRQGEEELWQSIENSISYYCIDTEYRLKVVSKMNKLVDGNGATRLAKKLIDNN